MIAIKNFMKDETGASAIEYGLLAALIALVVAISMKAVQGGLTGVFGRVATCLSTGNCS